MALKYGFYDSHDGDREYAARDFTSIFNNLIMDGVLPKTVSTNQFAATPAASGLGVKIDSGWAWFDSTYTHLTSAQTFTLDAADSVLYRWDAIVIETDAENRENSIKVIKGTPAAEGAFVKPTLTSNQHPLCYAKVTPGLTKMVQSNIENRVGFSDCPFIVGAVGSANLDQVFSQWEYDFDTWFDGVVDTLSGDVAGNLLALIQQNQADIEQINAALNGKASAATVESLAANLGTGAYNCRIAFGHYVGDGQYGPNHKNSLQFEFTPVFVYVVENDNHQKSPMVRGCTETNSTYGNAIHLSWTDNSISWWCDTGITNPHLAQNNSQDRDYYWFAIGYPIA